MHAQMLLCDAARFSDAVFDLSIYLTVLPIYSKLYVMTKASPALTQMPPSTLAALEQLGADLAVARLRRKESLKTWAKRMGVSVPTLLRLEAGEPSVSLGVLATALWLIGRDAALGALATPKEDRGALELDVRQAETLGKERVRATAQAKMKRANQRRGQKSDAARGHEPEDPVQDS
jgi:transcriptional regulator with XRE-family HTH domain